MSMTMSMSLSTYAAQSIDIMSVFVNAFSRWVWSAFIVSICDFKSVHPILFLARGPNSGALHTKKLTCKMRNQTMI